MSLFNIKLKTKNGNDVKKKQTITVIFRIKLKMNALTKKFTAEYTYRIYHQKGMSDPLAVLQIRDADKIAGIEDLILKVMLNMCHIIGKITKAYNIDPDYVIFISPDFDTKKNKSWQFLSDVFRRPTKYEKKNSNKSITADWLEDYSKSYEETWSEEMCNRMKINKVELDMLKSFSDINPNTFFITLNPTRDPVKYEKSIALSQMLQDRLDRNLQIPPIKSDKT